MPDRKRTPRKKDEKRIHTKMEIITAVQEAYNGFHEWTGDDAPGPFTRDEAEQRKPHDSLNEHLVIVLDEMLDQAPAGELVAEALHQVDWSINALTAVRDRLIVLLGYELGGDASA